MLSEYKLNHILFLDIETVPICRHFNQMPENYQKLFKEKFIKQQGENQSTEDFFEERAGIISEFAKIICISVGIIDNKSSPWKFRIKSFFGDDETTILTDFCNLLNDKFNASNYYLCAHNGKEFDFPFIARRLLINSIPLPKKLDFSGKKPWEIKHLDTLEIWKFGDYKHYTSLNLLATIFNIPTPKDDITGKEVKYVYWDDKDLKRIVNYCQKDTLTVAQLLLKYKGEKIINPENVIIA